MRFQLSCAPVLYRCQSEQSPSCFACFFGLFHHCLKAQRHFSLYPVFNYHPSSLVSLFQYCSHYGFPRCRPGFEASWHTFWSARAAPRHYNLWSPGSPVKNSKASARKTGVCAIGRAAIHQATSTFTASWTKDLAKKNGHRRTIHRMPYYFHPSNTSLLLTIAADWEQFQIPHLRYSLRILFHLNQRTISLF